MITFPLRRRLHWVPNALKALNVAIVGALIVASGPSSIAWAKDDFSGGVYSHSYAMAERTLEHLYATSDSLFSACLKLDCLSNQGLDSVRATEVLGKIATGLASLPRGKRLLVFESEKKAPGTFIIDGNLKLAKTGTSFGTPIYYNLDLLYRVNERGEKIPLSEVTLLANLVHELGHHAGEKDHLFLDRMGLAFAQFAANLQKDIPLQEDEIMGLIRRVAKVSLRLTDFFSKNLGPKFPSFNLSLRDEVGWHDITTDVRSALQCADKTTPQSVWIERIDWHTGHSERGRLAPLTILPSEIPIPRDTSKYTFITLEIAITFGVDAILDCPSGPEATSRRYSAIFGEGIRRYPSQNFEYIDTYYYIFARLNYVSDESSSTER